MMNSRRTLFSAGWESMVLSSVLLLHIIALCVNGSSFISNSTGTNSSDLNGVEVKPAFTGENTPIARAHVHSRKPRAGDESGSGGETSTSAVTEITVDTSEREHLVGLTIGGIAARLPTLAESQKRALFQLDFNEEGMQDSAPHWKSNRLQADGTLLDPVTSPPSESSHSKPEEIITVNFHSPSPQLEIVHDPPGLAQELQGGDPTSWTDFYDYLSPDYSPTEVYLEESQPTPPDMEDENVPFIASAVPSNTGVVDYSGSGESLPGAANVLGNSGCLLGFVRRNGTCVSPCDIFTGYCFNGGRCYVVDGIGAFCRCNIQEYIWNKGSRCESVISDFQVMCIAVGGAAIMLLLLFMVIVFFSKRLHVLKTENRRLRKHSKYRPKSEQHIDNFSLSTVAEGSQANKTMSRYTWEYKPKEDPCSEDDTSKEEPCKCPPKEDESLNNQNSVTPKLENDKPATEDNAEEGGVTIDLELLLPKEAKMVPETSPPLHYNVFLYKLPKSPKKSPVLRRPPGRSVQGRPLSQLCPRRSSEPGYSPISTRSLPGVLSGSSSPRLGTAYTP
ncbi:chondroitin sulfate proteoglycan 5b isoform X3 [Danio rerio]|uniref:Chondroitin sulfate proteoglycan 5b isoform X3 n=1 Tax=Danio rerio TaxID=7955 RepID=A0A8M2B667_DANRE|nr:chondroitin sulfate proteoglycan 5 (neuroglycan C) isoform X2 [Danio rerio]|eukprot:XP_005159572.2 chondroitin sulfate proteoglycan 5 (neuroglycan C) isoform X2 [Danio rerio]